MIKDGMVFATIDMGSNSFRLEMAKVDHGMLVRTEYYKEPVRLGAGFDSKFCLTPEAIARSAETLTRFREKIDGINPQALRAVATQSLRTARNPQDFLGPCQQALGHPIEILSGHEEARLIYQGVSNDLPDNNQTRLVVDIGGGSTEFILGRNKTALDMSSYRIGCVSQNLRFFDDRQPSQKQFDKATVAACAQLEDASKRFAAPLFEEAIGSSGTVEAISEMGAVIGLGDIITQSSMNNIIKIMVNTDPKKWPFDLKPQRAQVICGGISVLQAVFDRLNVQQMRPCYSALRQGVLLDLFGRASDNDIRFQSVKRLQKKLDVDVGQAQRVHDICMILYQQISGQDHLSLPLSWAADLHEIGIVVSHESYHKHSAYLMANSDLSGFSKSEQLDLSDLLLLQRGGLRKKTERLSLSQRDFVQQLICLRLAIILCHARTPTELPKAQLSLGANNIQWPLTQKWRTQNPLASYLLDEECFAWQKVGYQLLLDEVDARC